MLKDTPPSRASNSRFIASEKRLTSGLLHVLRIHARCFNIRPCDIYKAAKTSKGTFFNHYKDATSVVNQLETDLLTTFQAKVLQKHSLNSPIEPLLGSFLFFLHSERKIINIELSHHDYSLIFQMLQLLKPRITKHWSNYSSNIINFIYTKYIFIVYSIIFTWHFKSKLDKNHIDIYLRELIYFTHHASKLILRDSESSSRQSFSLDIISAKGNSS